LNKDSNARELQKINNILPDKANVQSLFVEIEHLISAEGFQLQKIAINEVKTDLSNLVEFQVEEFMSLNEFPDSSAPLNTKKGKAYYIKSEVFRKIMWYAYADETNNMMAIPIDKVKFIISQNEEGKLPDELEKFAEKNTQVDNVDDGYSNDITGYI